MKTDLIKTITAIAMAFCVMSAFVGQSATAIAAENALLQQRTTDVRGVVSDDTGPLPGISVIIQGTTIGTLTDLDGAWSLNNVPVGATLEFSSMGYVPQTVVVGDNPVIDILLKEDTTELEAVVMIGYGTQKKADLTGSVSIVDVDELKKTSNSNISTMLQGKVAGVQVTTDGQPGADPTVRIRGIGSFNDTSPLYVIDGVPMGTSIRDFSSNDIETIQVLKDASAAAIYGSRAANGVIIITTKHGKKDQPMRVDYNGYFGVDYIPSSVYNVMNATQYSNYLAQACENSGTALPSGYVYDSTTGAYRFYDDTDTNWFDEVFKTGTRQNHNVNLSGGGAHSTYNIGLDYFSQKGTLEGAGPNYERFTVRANNTMDTKFVKFQTGLVYSFSDQDNMSLSNASEYVQGLYGDVSNVLKSTLLMQPTIKAYDSSTWVLDDVVGAASDFTYDGYGYGVYYDSIHGDISASNPLLVNNLLQRNTRVSRFVGTLAADVDLFNLFGFKSANHSLNYRLNLSYSKTHCMDNTWIPSWIQSNRVYLSKSNERLEKGSRDYSDALIENIITYDGTMGKHHLTVMAAQTYEEEYTELLTGWGLSFTEPYYLQLQNAENTYSSSYEYEHVLFSYLGRIIYDYDGRYLFSATVRRDASSRLTKSIRWGTFPSVSFGWRFDKEKFFPFDLNVVNLFKIRASYGELGNENIGEYAYQATMMRNNMTYSFNNSAVTGSAISTFVDNNLSWEKKKSYNAGVDLAFLNNRLEFTAEWYKNISQDLLYDVPVPTQAGVSNETVTMNAASMDNSGLEFSLTYRNYDREFKYDISANLSTLTNRVTSLGFGTDYYLTGNYITIVGQEVGQFYGYVYEGIARTQEDLDNHATQSGANVGDCLYQDTNNDGVIDEDDRVVLGSGLPKVNFGLNFHFEFKRFDLSIVTYGALGFHVSDDIYNSLISSYGWSNKDVSLLDANRWSEDGTTYISSVPRTYITNSATMSWNDLFSSRYIQNAAYWKIANVELGYNFPDKWFRNYVRDVRFYVSAQNLYTFTGYKGYNVDYAGGTFTPGYNFCSYPTARTIMCGIHLSF